jgi:hypothetical protein
MQYVHFSIAIKIIVVQEIPDSRNLELVRNSLPELAPQESDLTFN